MLPVPASSLNSFTSGEGSAERLWEPRAVASNHSDPGILDKVGQQQHWCSGVSGEDCSPVKLRVCPALEKDSGLRTLTRDCW